MKCDLPIPARYLVAVTLSVGLSIVYGLKANLSIAILYMVKRKHQPDGLNKTSPCDDSVQHVYTDGPFDWSTLTQGLILAGYFMGYLACQWLGALAAEYLQPKWVLFGCVVCNVVACAVTPIVCLFLHYAWFVVLRVVQGFCSGPAFPSVHIIVTQWGPPKDQTMMFIIIYSGTALGTVVATAATAIIAASLSWEWAFYLTAIVCVPWCVVWAIFGSTSASKAHFLSDEERDYIKSALSVTASWDEAVTYPFPCKSACCSVPYWAILVAHFCSNCGWYAFITELPSFMKFSLHCSESQIYIFCTMAYFLSWAVAMEMGFVLVRLHRTGVIKMGTARKIATGFSSLIPAVCFLVLAFVECPASTPLILITLCIISIGALSLGVIANPMDLAPNFGAILIAITNTVACIPGIMMPLIIGSLLESKDRMSEWLIGCLIMMAIYVIMFIIYTIFGSGEEQPWNAISEEFEEVKEE